MKSKKRIKTAVVCVMLLIALSAAVRFIPEYLEKISPLESIYSVEESNQTLYDREHNLSLKYNKENCCFDVYNEEGLLKYNMHARRGFGRYLFVSFCDCDDEVNFTGSLRFTDDGKVIEIETKNGDYKTMSFAF